MNFGFKIITEKALLIDRYVGDLTYQQVVKAHRQEVGSENFKYVKNAISDLREARFEFTDDQMEEFAMFIGETVSLTRFKWAILVSTPYETAISILLSKFISKYIVSNIVVCSTLETVNDFFSMNISENDFIGICS